MRDIVEGYALPLGVNNNNYWLFKWLMMWCDIKQEYCDTACDKCRYATYSRKNW